MINNNKEIKTAILHEIQVSIDTLNYDCFDRKKKQKIKDLLYEALTIAETL